MTPWSGPVRKRNYIFSFLQRTDYLRWPPLLFSKDDSKYRKRADSADLNRGKKEVIWGGVGRENTASVDGTISNPTLQ